MSAESSRTTPLSTHFAIGARVAVRSSFDGSWCSGFQIFDVVQDADGVAGFRLRRTADQSVLPAVFSVSEVIPEGR